VSAADLRHDWTIAEIEAIYTAPLPDLVFRAQQAHRLYHQTDQVQGCMLLSIKTGGCPEDCAYCPQSAHYKTDVSRSGLVSLDELTEAAAHARAQGATRFCMGAAWRDVPNNASFDRVLDMVRVVRGMGMEACCTLGMLTQEQADQLADAGLTAYNHNLDTSPEFYGSIITTRTYDERLETLARVRQAGVSVCCGGIIGLGESLAQRAEFAAQLADLEPDEVPMNFLNPRPGTPFGDLPVLEGNDALRTIAAFRLALPRTILRFAGGRELTLGDLGARQGMLGGINAVIVGNYLTTLGRPVEADIAMLGELKMPIKALSTTF